MEFAGHSEFDFIVSEFKPITKVGFMKASLLLLFIAVSSPSAWAQESVQKLESPEVTTLSTSTDELPKPGLLRDIKVSGRVSLLTTQATKAITYRDLKTTGADDASQNASGSERTTAANIRYLSASSAVSWNANHETAFGLIKSLSSEEDRNVTTPFGVSFTMPGDIVFLRQTYLFTPNYSVSVQGGYTDIAEYRDPSFAFNYVSTEELGWAPRWGISASAPATPASYDNGLITKTALRMGIAYRAVSWGTFTNVSFNQGIYKDTQVLGKAHGVTAASARPPGGGGGPGGPGGPPGGFRPTFEPIDLLLSEAEVRRTSTNAGIYFHATPKIRLMSSMGVSRVDTYKGNELWLSAAKPIGVQYRMGPLEANADVLYFSDVKKYKSLTLPENLSIGVNVAFNFGDRPIRR